MKITINSLGKIATSEIEFNDLTILVGDNNSGKTYVTYTIYGLLKNWTDFINYNSFKNFIPDLKNKGQITLDKDKIIELVDKSILTESASFHKKIRDLFNDKEKIFSDAKIKLEFQKPKDFKNSEKKIQIGKNIVFEGKIYNNNLTINFIQEGESEIDTLLFNRVIGDLFAKLIFDDIFPDPMIVTAERLGISLFYKELDEKRNSLVDGLQKLEDKADFHPIEFLLSMSAYYATPIKDHIAFTRNLDNIKKYTSNIDSTYPIEIIKDILGAEFKKENKQDIRFHTKNKKNNKFDIPLHLASSSARCIVDIYFYLKHIAKEGDVLIIDEPESHLTLRNQRLMAKLIASIVNLKIKVFITTHSDFLVKELNNLISLNNDFENKKEWLQKNKKIYIEKDKLNHEIVSVYNSKDGFTEKLNVTYKGIEIPFFDDEINRLFNVSNDLDFFIE